MESMSDPWMVVANLIWNRGTVICIAWDESPRYGFLHYSEPQRGGICSGETNAIAPRFYLTLLRFPGTCVPGYRMTSLRD